MSDSPRLAELRRQRALVAEHLAWLDREITATAGQSKAASPPIPAVATPSPTETAPMPAQPPAEAARSIGPDSTAADTELDAEAEAVMAKFRVAPSDLQRDVRKGCLIYFVAAFVLFGAGIAALYFALRH